MSARPGVGRLHVLTDESLGGAFTHLELARAAAAGGADVVQLREKRDLPRARVVELAGEMRAAVVRHGARLIVDDRIDVARETRAHGVHLGRHDAHPEEARALLGPDCWIGRTANDPGEARRWSRSPVDYLGVGPVFGTGSKRNPAPALGLETLARIARDVDRPVIAIGSITAERVAGVLDAGAHGIAVLSAVALAADPEAATRRFREAIEAWTAARDRRTAGEAGG